MFALHIKGICYIIGHNWIPLPWWLCCSDSPKIVAAPHVIFSENTLLLEYCTHPSIFLKSEQHRLEVSLSEASLPSH